MTPAYYICGTCGARVPFGPELTTHQCHPTCLICKRRVAVELSGAVRVNEGWMHDACQKWDAAGRPVPPGDRFR